RFLPDCVGAAEKVPRNVDQGGRLWIAKLVKSASRTDHGVGPRTRASALGCGLVWLSAGTVHYFSRPCPGVFPVVYDHLSVHQHIFDAIGREGWFKIGGALLDSDVIEHNRIRP